MNNRKIKEFQFKMRLNSVLQNATTDELNILKEMLNKEIQKRNNRKENKK